MDYFLAGNDQPQPISLTARLAVHPNLKQLVAMEEAPSKPLPFRPYNHHVHVQVTSLLY